MTKRERPWQGRMVRRRKLTDGLWFALLLGSITPGCGGELEEAGVATTAADLEALRPSAAGPEWIRTPAGSVHRTCLYRIGEDAVGQSDGSLRLPNGAIIKPPPCAHPVEQAPQVNGWIIARHWTIGTWLSKLTSTMTVPAEPPTQGSQLLYFFPGSEGSDIVQPVLQWGSNGAFGGPYWMLASWFGGGEGANGNYYHSTPKSASPGDTLAGNMVASNCQDDGACNWTITSKNLTRGTSTSILSSKLPAQTWILGGVLEVYHVDSCSQEAASAMRFTNLAVYNRNGNKVTPSWQEAKWNPACSVSSSATSTSVTLSYLASDHVQ